MSKPGFSKLAVGVLVVLLLVVQLVAAAGVAEEALEDCKGQQDLIRNCQKYVKKGARDEPPSQDCCTAIQGADLPCLCKGFTPVLAKLIDVDRVCTVAKYCGAEMPKPGTMCGDVEVPQC